MLSCTILKETLVLGLNKKVAFVGLEKCKVLHEFEIPKKIEVPIGESHQLGDSEDVELVKHKSTQIPFKIQHVVISPSGQFLVVTTSGQKALLLYEIKGNREELLSQRSISRTSSAVTFSSDSTKILITDKSGDCYLYDCLNPHLRGKWIFGHLSMILGVLFSPQERFVLTCDRDEKVRVTNYPNCYEIESYCLGHLEYVSAIAFLPQKPEQFLVSLSGDKTIRVWSYVCGKQEHQIEIPAPGVKFTVRQVNETTCHIAAIVYQPNESIFVYKLSYADGKFTSSLLTKKSYSSKIMADIHFCNDKLYCIAVNNGRLQVAVLRYDNENYSDESNDELQTCLDKSFPNDKIDDMEDISGWFKKKFDNVSEYMERKKKRIEDKEKQKQAS